ncbi:MAG TPA: hypothetical protein VHX38_09000 [Pseudonocardiaceae bacterium]|jgi:hypothetical protein|nr:hypothetical protein [Pseudonocardiaceae bacterium]
MAKSSKPDKPVKGKTDKPKTDPEPRTQRLPHLQKVVDEFFTNWPSKDDNDRAGD